MCYSVKQHIYINGAILTNKTISSRYGKAFCNWVFGYHLFSPVYFTFQGTIYCPLSSSPLANKATVFYLERGLALLILKVVVYAVLM